MSTRLYLYNGQEYAVLPSRDKVTYPFGLIWTAGETRFVYSDLPFTYDANQNMVVSAEGATVYTRLYNATAKSWNGAGRFSGDSYTVDASAVVWTNSDISDNAGELFLAATAPVFVETRPAPLSLKKFMTGLLDGLTDTQTPLCDALPITGYAYNGVPLAKIVSEELVGHRFAVIYGGTAGKYHLCLFSARPIVYTGGTGKDLGFIASSWFISYKIFANYSAENENLLLREWCPFSTGDITQTGRIDYEIPLVDDFIKSGILWSSFDLYGDDSVLRRKATHIYPVSEVIGSG